MKLLFQVPLGKTETSPQLVKIPLAKIGSPKLLDQAWLAKIETLIVATGIVSDAFQKSIISVDE